MKPTLHFIVDPLCGWCYGASSLFKATLSLADVDVKTHGGGLLIDDRVRRITPDWKAYVAGSDQKIEAISHEKFGDAYKNGLLNDTEAVLDSEPPIKSLMCAEELGFSALSLLIGLQKAMYLEGREISKFETLYEIAVEQGMSGQDFETGFNSIHKNDFDAHIGESHHLLRTLKGNGFPSAGLTYDDGRAVPLNIAQYYGNPSGWLAYLKSMMSQ